MLTYNTHLPQLVMPEYGRVIQNMVNHCLTIENREERTRCATTIVESMKTLFQPDKNDDEAERRYWDHLAMMSNFELDIDWPYEIIRPDSIKSVPERVDYDRSEFGNRRYGRNLMELINTTAGMEPGEAKDNLTVLLANQMKKALLAWDPDGASNELVFADLERLSGGKIKISPEELMLCDYIDAPKPAKKKKKK